MPIGRSALFLLLALGAQAQDRPVGFGFAYLVPGDGRPVVTAVAPGGAAEAAGLVPGDTLLSVGGRSVTNLLSDQVRDVLVSARDGEFDAEVRLWRNGAEHVVTVGVAPYDPEPLTRASRRFFCESGDCIDGRGVWASPDGTRYEGTFRDGLRHGKGTYLLPDGGLYVGSFDRGIVSGRGAFFYPNGGHYAGDVADDMPHGFGVLEFANEQVYAGTFTRGQLHGWGTLRRPDGTYWTGRWIDDEGVEGTEHAADGTVVNTGPYTAPLPADAH